MDFDLLNIEDNEKSSNLKHNGDFEAHTIRIYPTKEQKIKLNKWFGASRFIYNKCLNHLKQQTSLKGKLSKKYLRKKFINDENYSNENIWMLDIHYDVRDEAMNDLLHNYNTNFSKQKINKNYTFDIKFRSRKDLKQSICVLSKHWNHKSGVYSDLFGRNKLKSKYKNEVPYKLEHTSRLKRTKLGQYFLSLPTKTQKPSISPDSNIVSIDPGVRTFLTCYDPNGNIIEFGKDSIGTLARLLHYKNKLQSRIKTSTQHKKRYKIKRAFYRLNLRIENMVLDCHKKIVKTLCSNYNKILIPKMNFHNFKMSKRNRAKMAVWSHCSFVDRLKMKSKTFSNCKVEIVKEDYTSKTCGRCGILNNKLGGSKTFNCSKCSLEIDRDFNGARNILLKYISEISKDESIQVPFLDIVVA